MVEVIDITDELPTHPEKEYPTRDVKTIDGIDIHHSASLTSDYEGIETIKAFARTHIRSEEEGGNGWPGIGYNYIVPPTRDRIVYKVGLDSQLRWSVGNHNSHIISTMIVGHFEKEDPLPEQYETAIEWVNQKQQAYGVGTDKVWGHNEYDGHRWNSCPGIDMRKFREDLAQNLDNVG